MSAATLHSIGSRFQRAKKILRERVQDALFEYLRDEMALGSKVQRGAAKSLSGPDHKSAEQLRLEELDSRIDNAQNEQQEVARLRGELEMALSDADRDRDAAAADAAKSKAQREATEAADAQAARQRIAMQQAIADEVADALAANQADAARMRAELRDEIAAVAAERQAANPSYS